MASLECGRDGDYWVGHALDSCVPDDVWEKHGDTLAFVSTTESDGKRLTRKFAEGKHVIVLSERVIPHGPLAEDHPAVRYLYFVVLHETAHAICNHQPPNEISREQNDAQEKEADDLAFGWFNSYLATQADKGVALFTEAELAAIQAKMQERMQAALKG